MPVRSQLSAGWGFRDVAAVLGAAPGRDVKRKGIMDGSGLVPVMHVQGRLVGHVMKSKLESRGIPVLLRYDAASVVFGLTVDGLGEVEVLVPGHLAAQARAVLAEPVDEDAVYASAGGDTEGDDAPY